jgi:hypothetical protein
MRGPGVLIDMGGRADRCRKSLSGHATGRQAFLGVAAAVLAMAVFSGVANAAPPDVTSGTGHLEFNRDFPEFFLTHDIHVNAISEDGSIPRGDFYFRQDAFSSPFATDIDIRGNVICHRVTDKTAVVGVEFPPLLLSGLELRQALIHVEDNGRLNAPDEVFFEFLLADLQTCPAHAGPSQVNGGPVVSGNYVVHDS